MERRSLLLPRKWKVLFGFLGFSGIVSTAGFLVGGGKAWEKWDSIQEQAALYQRQQLVLIRQVGALQGRIAELTIAENETRAKVGLSPLLHQSILDGGGDAGDRPVPVPREALRAVLPVAQRRESRP